MTNIKKTLKNAGIWCLVATIISVLSLISNIYLVDFVLYNIIWDIIGIILSITTGIIYLCYSKKNKEKLLKPRKIFFILTILNIFNNLIVWVLSFWVQISYNKEMRTIQLKQMFNMGNNNQSFNSQNNPDDNIITIDKEDYEIKEKTEKLTDKLEELKELRRKNLISEDEYEKLRQEALRKFMS